MSNNFTTIEAAYRIVTPMFCAGADQNTAELRLPSFKGALRFWWRSLMWGKVGGIADLRKKEAELFGSSDQTFGQSKVRMRLIAQELQPQVKKGEVFEGGKLSGAHYLGYGVMESFYSSKTGKKAGELSRPIIPGGTFTVQLRLGPNLSDEHSKQVQNALILLGTVGGIGSKSRKGFGSLTLTSLENDEQSIELGKDTPSRITSVVGQREEGLPDWTAWSRDSRIVTASNGQCRAVDLLDLLGREQVHFRSWGSDNRGRLSEHRTLGVSSEQNFKFDHDLSKGPQSGEYPKRIVFGLPHNYQTGGVQPAAHDRRASPLFLHIHQPTKNDSPVGVVAFLPSLFLPEDEKIKAFGRDAGLHRSDGFWSPIHAFLDRLISTGQEPDKRSGYEEFPQDSEWWNKQTDLQATEVTLG